MGYGVFYVICPGASSRFVTPLTPLVNIWLKMERPRLLDSMTKSIIEHCHNDQVFWDVNNTNVMNLEVKDAAWQRISALF